MVLQKIQYNLWSKRNLKTKFLSCFLVLSVVMFAIITYVAFASLKNVVDFAENSISTFGWRAAVSSGDALEIVGKEKLLDKAQNVAKEVSAYLAIHPVTDSDHISDDLVLANIAVQYFGDTGYTYMYEETRLSNVDYGIIRFHPDYKIIGSTLNDHSEDHFSWITMTLNNNILGGYYYWEGFDGVKQYRFMYMVPLDGTTYVVPSDATRYALPDGDKRYMISVSISVDELRSLSRDIQDKISAESLQTQRYIQQQNDSMQRGLILTIIIALLATTILTYQLAKTVTKPISALTESSRILAQGDFEHRVKVNTGGEIKELADQFNRMASALKESYTNLESKVEERTRSERRKTDHLQAINEIGKEISSILSMDELLPLVTKSLQATFHYNVNIFLTDRETGNINMKFGIKGYDNLTSDGLNTNESTGMVRHVEKTGEPILVDDLTSKPYHLKGKNTLIMSEIAVPIKAGTELLGILNMKSTAPRAFDEIDLFTAKTIADQLAIALINARLYQEMRDIGVIAERNRLAREIHDTLAQGFMGIVLQLEGADQVFDKDTPRAKEHLNRAMQLARESLSEARRSFWALRPQALENHSLIKSLHHEIRTFIQDSGIEAFLDIYGKHHVLTPEIENALLLVFREALFNVRKHAHATRVIVSLYFKPTTIELSVKDNGVGFDPAVAHIGSFGLTSMKERVSLLRGRLNIKSQTGSGTLIMAVLPYNPEESNGEDQDTNC